MGAAAVFELLPSFPVPIFFPTTKLASRANHDGKRERGIADFASLFSYIHCLSLGYCTHTRSRLKSRLV